MIYKEEFCYSSFFFLSFFVTVHFHSLTEILAVLLIAIDIISLEIYLSLWIQFSLLTIESQNKIDRWNIMLQKLFA